MNTKNLLKSKRKNKRRMEKNRERSKSKARASDRQRNKKGGDVKCQLPKWIKYGLSE